MSRLELAVYLDYVDPVSYRLAKTLHARLGTRSTPSGLPDGIRVLPFEVCPPPQTLIDPEAEQWRGRWRLAGLSDSVRHGFSSEVPVLQSLIPWTRKAHELALHAAEKNRFAPVHEALFEAHLVRGKDIGRVDVLVELAVAHGLDRTETKAVLDVDRFSERIAIMRTDAVAQGVSEPGTLVTSEATVSGLARCFEVIDTLARAH